jgi:hypothetical protein
LANARRYIAEWQAYWTGYVPELMASGKVPDAAPWGNYPTLASSVTSKAAEVYNVMAHSFSPGTFQGILCLSSEKMVEANQGADFGEQLSALANSWKNRFGGQDQAFFYTIPSKTLAPKITQPKAIDGLHTDVEINSWSDSAELSSFMDQVVEKTYR